MRAAWSEKGNGTFEAEAVAPADGGRAGELVVRRPGGSAVGVSAAEYPLLAEFMNKCLFQLAAPTFEEAILQWATGGPAEVRRLLAEIDRAVAARHPDRELAAALARHADYGAPGGPTETLAHFGQVLRAWLAAAEQGAAEPPKRP